MTDTARKIEAEPITTERLQEMRDRLQELVDEHLPELDVCAEIAIHNAPRQIVEAVAALEGAELCTQVTKSFYGHGHEAYDEAKTPFGSTEPPRVIAYGEHRPLEVR